MICWYKNIKNFLRSKRLVMIVTFFVMIVSGIIFLTNIIK